MLDTNAVRALLERGSPQLDQWFAEERCSISAIVAAEIRFGLARRRLSAARHSLVEDLLTVLPIEPFGSRAAQSYGTLRAELMAAGVTLSAMDLLIASHALSAGCTLLTADQAFSQIAILKTRHW
jgi:tRNA(fMet)-specific endonuclease VapC